MKDIMKTTGPDPPLFASLKGWFSRNVLLKVTSLAIGLFLWFNAVTDQAHQMDYPVPLEIVVSDTTLIIVNDPVSDVNIIFAGTGKELLKLWWKKPFFIKEVEGGEVGVRNLNLDVSSLSIPTDLNLIPLGIKSPTSLHVTLDKLVEKEVRVCSRLKVQPKEEYVILGDVLIDPPTVVLTGARGELSDLDSVKTVESLLNGVEDSFSTTLQLDLSSMRTVTTEVQEVTISGRVEQYVEIELEGIPITLRGRLKKRFSVQPDMIQLVVIGPISLIQSLRKEEVDVYIEINDPPVGETYYSPMIELPEGIDLLSEQPKLFKAVPVDEANNNSPENLTRASNYTN
jgi:YbbR domain-containing protein